MADETVPLALYSAALDEIYHLRTALAYEASVAEAHGGYKTFPKSRRPILEDQIERMRDAARGGVMAAYAGRSWLSLHAARKDAGARPTMTRVQWEAERRRSALDAGGDRG